MSTRFAQQIEVTQLGRNDDPTMREIERNAPDVAMGSARGKRLVVPFDVMPSSARCADLGLENGDAGE